MEKIKNSLLILAFGLVISTSVNCQYKTQDFSGHWVLSSINPVNGNQLSERLAENYNYMSLEFREGQKVKKAHQPLFDGFLLDYSIRQDILTMGTVKYYIEHVSTDSLVLIEEGQHGFSEDALKMIFIPEQEYQMSLPLNPSNVFTLNGKSVYVEDEKIHANFDQELSYHEFIFINVRNSTKYVGTGEFFCATFVISESGKIDSIQIHKGLDNTFNKQFFEALQKSSEYIIPGKLEGATVSILRVFFYPFSTNTGLVPFPYSDFYTDDLAKGIVKLGEYNPQDAMTHFQNCLVENPKNIEALYQMGKCYYLLGDMNNACNTWKTISELKSKRAITALKKYCE